MLKKRSDTTETEPQKAPIDVGEVPTHSILPTGEAEKTFRDLNPFYLRRLYEQEKDPKRKEQMWNALKEWSNQYSYSRVNPYPYKQYFNDIQYDYIRVANRILDRLGEVQDPSRNLFYYQEQETAQHPDVDRFNDGNDWLNPPIADNDRDSQDDQDEDSKKEWQRQFPYAFPPGYEQNRPEENRPWGQGENYSEPYKGEIALSEERNRGTAKMSFFKDFVFNENCDYEPFLRKKMASKRKKFSKVVKLSDLAFFTKVSENLLIHRCEKDLWSMEQDDDGNIVVSRLFDNEVLK